MIKIKYIFIKLKDATEIIIIILVILFLTLYFHKHPYDFHKTYPLYSNGVPDKNGLTKTDEKVIKVYNKTNISTTKYYVFHPTKNINTGQAVIILPGGGYYVSSYGTCLDTAKYFASQGITGIVLLYRMPNKKYPNIPVEDVYNMIKLTRKNSAKWNIDPNKIGVMGFSAGGHLAAFVSTNFDVYTKPDFTILYYPVISMVKSYMHMDSKHFFMGEVSGSKMELEKFYSPELNIKVNTPPAYIVHCYDDNIVSPDNSRDYSKALNDKNIKNKLVLYPKCGHGWDWESKNFPYTEQDKKALIEWIKAQ